MEAAIATQATSTMWALIQDGYGAGDVLHLREIERPTVEAGRVLLRVRAASINAMDYHQVHGGTAMQIAGTLMRQQMFPIRGADVAGIVEAVGPDVTRLAPGDEVFGTARGSLAEFTTAREDRLVRKPPQLSFADAAAIPVAGVTALQGLRDRGRLRTGQRVLVNGAGGGVGTYAVQIAKALGAHVTAVTSTKSVELVRPLGADALVDYTKEDFTRRPERYDLLLDVAANRSIADCRRVLAPGGIFVQVGASKQGGIGIFMRLGAVTFRSSVLRQRVVPFIASVTKEDLLVLKELVERGELKPVIDRTYPLAQAVEAMRYAESGQARAKVVVEV